MTRSAASNSPRSRLSGLLMMMAMLPTAVLPPYAIAAPTGGQIVSGNVTINAGGAGQLNINQTSAAAIVNWQDFSIGAGETVNIQQLNAQSALLNRVTGANPSQLLGQLNANGRVILINPNGVIVGAGANLNMQEFIASSLNVDNDAFLNFARGDSDALTFAGDSKASVVNLGSITATNGDVVLIAYRVANEGEITAANGVAGLAAGSTVRLRSQADQRVYVETNLATAEADGTGVSNTGTIDAVQAELKAAGGNLYALAINQAGLVRVTGMENRHGRILLTAEGGTINVDGKLSAHDADGSGGEVLVGGDYQGANAAVANAAYTQVSADSVIDVSATNATGDGGRAIVWADQQTDFAGKIEGQGGALGGDGAFAEVSGKHILNYAGLADLSAPFGATGTLLLDPDEAIISTATDSPGNGVFNNTIIATNLATSNVTINASTFGNGDYQLKKQGDITVNAPITWTSGNTLTLKAGNSVLVNADLTGTGGDIVFQVMGVNSNASVTSASSVTITADSLTIEQNPNSAFVGFNPEPAQYRDIKDITLDGVVNVGTLDIKNQNAGIDGDISITNAANAIGTLASSVAAGSIKGDIHIVDGSGGLNVTGDFSNLTDGHATTITTKGALTLGTGAKLASGAGGNVVLAAQGGAFTNNAGASAVTVGAGGRFLIYSDDPANITKGGLTGDPVYDQTFAVNAPASITQSGNRFLYSLAPTITFTANNLSRLYGAANPALAFTATGLVGGDSAGAVYTGTPTLSTTALASDDVGTAAIAIAAGTVAASDYGYKIAYAPGTLTINPAPLTITADNQSKTKGQANPVLTATYDGLVNDDTAGDITGLALATAADTSSPVGTYAITASGATNANYDISFVNGVMTINGAPVLTITADSFNQLYGAPLPDYTASITGFNSPDTASIVTGLTLSSTATVGAGVGTYTITPSGASASGYDITFVNGILTINPALLTITANNVARIYGAANPNLGATFAGFVNGENTSVVSGLTLATTATGSSDVGAYAITASGATAANYTITENPGTLTVGQASLTITADDASKVYADNNPTFTATDAGRVLSQTLADIGTLNLAVTATQYANVGTYAITPSFTSTTGLASNYATSFVNGTFTISQRPITAYATHETRIYGDPNPTVYWGLRGDKPPGVTNLYNIFDYSDITYTTAATPASDVGVYAYTLGDLEAANPNFAVTYEAGSITVTSAPLTVRVTNRSRLYGSENPAWVTGSTGLKLTDTVASVIPDLTFATLATITSNVGSYTVTPDGTVANSNYDVTFANGTLTINKAPLTITPTLSSRLYGDPDPTFDITATGLLNGDTAAVVTNRYFSGTLSTWGVGTRTNVIQGATATNYVLSFNPGTINILARPLTITANDFSREYGDANPTFTAWLNGLASFDDITDLTGLSFNTVADLTSSVLSTGYAITPQGVANANYDITYAPGKLVVTPAPLTVNLPALTRTYGDTTATPVATVNTGFKNADTISTLGLSYDQLAAPTDNVGTSAYTATASNANYNVSLNGGTQTITAAPLTVDVSDVYRTYGDANPSSFAVHLGGLKFAKDTDEVVAVSSPADKRSAVGDYAFDATLLDSNYTISSLSGDLTVRPRSLDVVATGTRVYGDPNPDVITFTMTGDFANDDLARDAVNFISYDRSLALNSNVGTYDISAAASYQPVSSNYIIHSFAASLGVTPRPVTVAIEDARRFYGDANPAFRFSTESNIKQSFDAIGEVLRFIAPDKQAEGGTYTISAELINSNYTLSSLIPGKLSIDPRPLTITVGSSARLYGDDNAQFVSATYGGLGLPDFVDANTFLSFRTVVPTDARSNVGHYLISTRAEDVDLKNYTVFNFTPGVLTILPRPLQLTVADLTAIFAAGTDLNAIGDLNAFDFVVNADNLANGDTVAEVFPNLGFEFWGGDKVVAAASGATPESYESPTVGELESSGSTTDVAYGDFVPLVIDGVADETPVAATSLSGSFSIPINFTITTREEQLINATSVELLRTVGPTGYQEGSPNYVVSGVTPGLLTLKARRLTDEQIQILEDEGEDALLGKKPIIVRSLIDYTGNFGLLFSDFPDLAEDMVLDFLRSSFIQGTNKFDKDSLFYAIFGETSGSIDDLNPATIQAWLSDIATNPMKRGAIGGAMVSYMDKLQSMDPSEYTMGQKKLTEVVAKKFQEKRDDFAGALHQQEVNFDQTPNASRVYYQASNAANVREQRAAVAAMDFLKIQRDNLTDSEISILEQIQSSIIDNDNTSTLPLLNAWFEARGDRAGDAFIDAQFRGFIAELTQFQNQMADAKITIDSGQDRAGVTDSAGGLQMVHDFVNIDPPYGQFLQNTAYAGLSAKMARYDNYANKAIYKNLDIDAGSVLSDSLVVGTAGGAAAGGASFAAIAANAGSIGKALFPYAKKASEAAAWTSKGLTVGSGMATIIAIVVQVGIEGTITAVQMQEQKTMYKSIVDDLGTKVSFADIDLTPENINVMTEDPSPKQMQSHLYKSLLVDGLEELLLGN